MKDTFGNKEGKAPYQKGFHACTSAYNLQLSLVL